MSKQSPPNTTLKIEAAESGPAFPRAHIWDMQVEELRALDFGHLAYIHIDNPNGKPTPLQIDLPVPATGSTLKNTRFSLKALAAFSPLVKSAIAKHGDLPDIDTIILPHGDPKAYTTLLTLLDRMITTGQRAYIPAVTVRPLTTYAQLISVAKTLQLRPVVTNLQSRLAQKLHHAPGWNWSIDWEDLHELYVGVDVFEGGEWDELRGMVVAAVAEAWMAGDLRGQKGRDVKDFARGCEAFWTDIKRLMEERGFDWKAERKIEKKA